MLRRSGSSIAVALQEKCLELIRVLDVHVHQSKRRLTQRLVFL